MIRIESTIGFILKLLNINKFEISIIENYIKIEFSYKNKKETFYILDYVDIEEQPINNLYEIYIIIKNYLNTIE